MTVSVDIVDGVAVVALDDGKMNAVNHELIDGLHGALDRSLADAGAVLIKGNAKALSAGFDLKVMQGADAGSVMKLVNAGGELLMRLFVHPQPTVVAVGGHALAAGALLVLACDTRIGQVGSPAKIGLNETAIGMALPEFAYELAAARLSKRYLTRAAVQAEIYDVEGAVAAGYLDSLADDCVAAATAEAVRLAALPGAAYAGTKSSLRQPIVDRVLPGLTR
jgi:enoyl-CoA hydratase